MAKSSATNLEINKVFVSSSKRISGTNSAWRTEVPGDTLECGPECVFAVDQLHIPVSWYNINSSNYFIKDDIWLDCNERGSRALDPKKYHKDAELLILQKIIEKQIIIYKEKYKSQKDYFITKWPLISKIEAWHVKLIKQGYQKSHIHPAGWLSGVFYLKVPKLLSKNEGSIEFTLSGYDYPPDKNLPNLIHTPKAFDIALFPSSLFHNTIPFSSQEERHVIAFDLIPK